MKRVKTVAGDDGETKITVHIDIDDYGGKLARHELETMIESLASAVMISVADTRYFGLRISQLKVT